MEGDGAVDAPPGSLAGGGVSSHGCVACDREVGARVRLTKAVICPFDESAGKMAEKEDFGLAVLVSYPPHGAHSTAYALQQDSTF